LTPKNKLLLSTPMVAMGVWLAFGSVSLPTLIGGEGAVQPAVAEATIVTATPVVSGPPAGRLFICGGGILPTNVLEKFVQLAGGAAAKIVYIPTASMYAGTPDLESRLGFWREQESAGRLKSFQVLHADDRAAADRADVVAPLKDATAVWFGGGTQSRITERYLGTAVEREVKQLLARGGMIGGTSAGAAIMSDVMIRGGAPEPDIGEGFGFLKNSVVDQHFIKRNRHARLANALHRHPNRVGIGIDEGTALILAGDHCEVVGDSKVLVCVTEAKQAAFHEIKPGEQVKLTQAVSQAHLAVRQYVAKQSPVVRTSAIEKIAADNTRTVDMPQTGR
jgi:cyanophycinase